MNYLAGIATGVILTAASFHLIEKYTVFYAHGVMNTQKIAFEKGFMTKEIDKDDKVIYKWIEPIKH